MLISIPPKYAVAQVIGYIKGKSAIHVARTYMGRKRNFVGQHFWARGYFASTVGRDEDVIREYIKSQSGKGRRLDRGSSGSYHLRVVNRPLVSGPQQIYFGRLPTEKPPPLLVVFFT